LRAWVRDLAAGIRGFLPPLQQLTKHFSLVVGANAGMM
jgi:hypothetical protein